MDRFRALQNFVVRLAVAFRSVRGLMHKMASVYLNLKGLVWHQSVGHGPLRAPVPEQVAAHPDGAQLGGSKEFGDSGVLGPYPDLVQEVAQQPEIGKRRDSEVVVKLRPETDGSAVKHDDRVTGGGAEDDRMAWGRKKARPFFRVWIHCGQWSVVCHSYLNYMLC